MRNKAAGTGRARPHGDVMRGNFSAGLACTLLLSTASAAYAQDPVSTAESALPQDGESADGGAVDIQIDAAIEVDTSIAGVVGYHANFFETFSPVTALDMVNQVPGFSLNGGDSGRRGLGDSFGNLLIDGERPSNKSLSLGTVLQRIPAGDVERIDLVQEALPQYDMRGHPRLVNVVLRDGAGQSTSWRVRASLHDFQRVGGEIEIARSQRLGSVQLSYGFNLHQSGNRINRREALYSGPDNTDADLVEIRRESDQRRYQEFTPNLSVNWSVSDATRLRFDARAQVWNWRRGETSYVFDTPEPGPVVARYDLSNTENEGSWFTTTTTLTHEFTDALSSETIFLFRRDRFDDGPFTFASFANNVGFVRGNVLTASGDTGETVLRETVFWSPNEDHEIQFGAEAAFNFRDTEFALFDDDGASLTLVPVPVSDTRVEETRGELFANHTWSVSEDVTLESGLRFEASEIAQESFTPAGALAFEQARTFSYPKPSITLNWRRTENTQWRFHVNRDVSQLAFGNFASSVNLNDNDQIVGNPDYVPERRWTAEAEWTRRYGENGSMSFTIGQDWIEDVDDLILILSPNDNGTPNNPADDFNDRLIAPGNIGDGTIFRLTWEGTAPLDFLGLDNAQLDYFLEWYDTNITDPITGEDRHLSHYREWEIRLDYRQTFPAHNFAWGWDYHWVTDGEVFRPDEYRAFGKTDGDLDVYVETTRWEGLTVRAGLDAVFNNGDDRERVFYDANGRAGGVVTGREFRNESQGTYAYLQLRGTF